MKWPFFKVFSHQYAQWKNCCGHIHLSMQFVFNNHPPSPMPQMKCGSWSSGYWGTPIPDFKYLPYRWICKKFVPMMGAFINIPVPVIGNIFENFTSMGGGKNAHFPSFAPWWVLFLFMIHHGNYFCSQWPHICVRISSSNTPDPP